MGESYLWKIKEFQMQNLEKERKQRDRKITENSQVANKRKEIHTIEKCRKITHWKVSEKAHP